MENQNIDLKNILKQPLAKLGIAISGMVLFFVILFWGLGTQYNLDNKDFTPDVCIFSVNCDQSGKVVTDKVESDELIASKHSHNRRKIAVTPLSASLISGGVSTIGLTILIGIGFLDLPIILALAGGALITSLTYSALQVLY